jgi:hypothetical protein
MDPQCFCCTTLRDVIFTEGDIREYYINDLYTTHVVVCWVTALCRSNNECNTETLIWWENVTKNIGTK